MKKAVLMMAVMSLALAAAAVPSLAADQKAVMEAEIAPQVLQFVGTTDVFETAAVWPQIKPDSGEETHECCPSYLAGISLQKRTQSPLRPMEYKSILTTDEISIDPKFRKKGKVLVTWTVRILAYPPEYETGGSATALADSLPSELDSKLDSNAALRAIAEDVGRGTCGWLPDWPEDCWEGSSANYEYTFKAGQQYGKVYSRLKDVTACGADPACEGRILSRDIVMTIPDGGVRTTYDPTHSGSMVLTPDMYGGELPAKMRFAIEWKNTSPFILYSEANMRNIIVTLTRD